MLQSNRSRRQPQPILRQYPSSDSLGLPVAERVPTPTLADKIKAVFDGCNCCAENRGAENRCVIS